MCVRAHVGAAARGERRQLQQDAEQAAVPATGALGAAAGTFTHTPRHQISLPAGPPSLQILASVGPSRQTLLFSATMPKALAEFARAGLKEPELVRLDADTKISPDLALAFFTVRWVGPPLGAGRKEGRGARRSGMPRVGLGRPTRRMLVGHPAVGRCRLAHATARRPAGVCVRPTASAVPACPRPPALRPPLCRQEDKPAALLYLLREVVAADQPTIIFACERRGARPPPRPLTHTRSPRHLHAASAARSRHPSTLPRPARCRSARPAWPC